MSLYLMELCSLARCFGVVSAGLWVSFEQCVAAWTYFYMVDSGSSLGAALAAREKGCNRVILFVGEGSLWVGPPFLHDPRSFVVFSQLSVQELSPMIRKGLTPIVFVINNSGYTIERCIHGLHRFVLHLFLIDSSISPLHKGIITTSLIGIGPLCCTPWTIVTNTKLQATLFELRTTWKTSSSTRHLQRQSTCSL